MKYRRINVFGASGSGATTLGRRIAEKLKLRHFDCDDYFHGPSDPPFQNPRSPLARYQMVMRDMGERSSWVLSGSVCGWDPYPPLAIDLMIFLFLPTSLRIHRLRNREFDRFGDRVRIGGDMHEIHEQFLQWASKYDSGGIDGKTLERHQVYLSQQPCEVIQIIGSPRLAEIMAHLDTRLNLPA